MPKGHPPIKFTGRDGFARPRRALNNPMAASPRRLNVADAGSGIGEARMFPRISPPGKVALWMLMYASPASMPAMLAGLMFVNTLE